MPEFPAVLNEHRPERPVADEEFAVPPDIPTDIPTAARIYDYDLGGKDNFAIDREWALKALEYFPEALDVARENRLFLYRAVRYLARDCGIRQFLDLGSGLPTQQNVHEVAGEFQPEARVVYVDNDPIVLAHGRALLADDRSTVVVTADMTDPETILGEETLGGLIDLSEPVAALFLSVTHSIPDDDLAKRSLGRVAEALAPGSYLAHTQFAGIDRAAADESTEVGTRLGLPWKARTREEIEGLVTGLSEGANVLSVRPPGREWAKIRITNHPRLTSAF
jgi:hypothetical protein